MPNSAEPIPFKKSKRTTPMTSEEYVASGGIRCPYCDHDDVHGDSIEVNVDGAWQDCYCPECENSWTDEYKLSGYTPEAEKN